jgi:hypothetical protein
MDGSILSVPCFRYDGTRLKAPIETELDETGRSYLRCRNRGIRIANTPEERVRQALLWFLSTRSDRSDTWSKSTELLVEHRQLDVVAYYFAGDLGSRFIPNLPVFIAETKRPEVTLELSDEFLGQLRGYMHRDRCDAGFYFNGEQVVWIAQTLPERALTVIPEMLGDLLELEDRIDRALAETESRLRTLERWFLSAYRGNFEALRLIARTIGMDTGLTFTLVVGRGEEPTLVQAFNLRERGETAVAFRERAVLSRDALTVQASEFRSLLSVRPLSWNESPSPRTPRTL